MKKLMLGAVILTCFFASDAQKAKTSISAKIMPMYGLNGVEWTIHLPMPHCGRYDSKDQNFEVTLHEVKDIDSDTLVVVCQKK